MQKGIKTLGWLNNKKKIFVKINPYLDFFKQDRYDSLLVNLKNGYTIEIFRGFKSLQEAILAAIDAALEYLTKQKNNE